MTTITEITVHNQSIAHPRADVDTRWLQFFDPQRAANSVLAHVRTLPSAKTKERYTEQVYSSGLRAFAEFAGAQLPREEVIKAYIAYLMDERGLKASTIASKYLAPLRHYLKALASQHIPATGTERDYVMDCKERIRAASEVKAPRTEMTSNVAPLWRAEFVRLDKNQVNAVLRAIDTNNIQGKRDYALMLIAFSTGLRLAELHRISMDKIRASGTRYLLTVRGKRNNIDPVPISAKAFEAIVEYVRAFNAGLDDDDPRYITPERPIWQPLTRAGRYMQPNRNGYTPSQGMTKQSIRMIINRRTGDVFGAENALAAHDTRRTTAAIAYDAGMPLPDLQALLRHKDAAVTLRYIGVKPDYESRSLDTYVQFG